MYTSTCPSCPPLTYTSYSLLQNSIFNYTFLFLNILCFQHTYSYVSGETLACTMFSPRAPSHSAPFLPPVFSHQLLLAHASFKQTFPLPKSKRSQFFSLQCNNIAGIFQLLPSQLSWEISKRSQFFQVEVETFKRTLLWMCCSSLKGKQRDTLLRKT